MTLESDYRELLGQKNVLLAENKELKQRIRNALAMVVDDMSLLAIVEELRKGSEL